MDEGFDYAEAFKQLDLEAVKKRFACIDDRFTGLVAGRFWSLWPIIHPQAIWSLKSLRKWSS
jgi:hypothetical protein